MGIVRTFTSLVFNNPKRIETFLEKKLSENFYYKISCNQIMVYNYEINE